MRAVLTILHCATLNLARQICHSFCIMNAIARVHIHKTTAERSVTIVRHYIYL
jgi:hypothetical protein